MTNLKKILIGTAVAATIGGAVLVTNNLTSTYVGKRIILTKGGDGGIYYVGGANPGDTLVALGNTSYTYIYIGVSGTEDRHIVLINQGQVNLSNGIATTAKYLDVLGDSVGKFGFVVTNSPGAAISIEGEAAFLKFSGISADGAQFFAWIKNEPACGASTNTFVKRNIEICNFSAKRIALEGVYAGSTNVVKVDGSSNVRPIYCNGTLTTIPPARLGKIIIRNGIFDGTGRAGAQISFASEDTCEIHDVVFRNNGREYDQAQGNSINIGSFTKAKVWNCDIKYSFTAGICSFGSYLEAWNNKIDSSGWLDGKTVAWGLNFWIDTRPTYGFEKPLVKIYNNTTLNHTNPKSIGVYDQVGQGYQNGNIVANNVNATLDIQPSIASQVTTQVATPSPIPTPTPTPQPTPTPTIKDSLVIFKKGYWVINNKYFYYTTYVRYRSGKVVDSIWSNKK